MLALTPAERRGALVVMVLLALGAGHDLWRAARPRETRAIAPPLERDSSAVGLAGSPPSPVAGDGTAGHDRSAGRPHPGDPVRIPVDLNHATAADLDRLPGVGPVLARRILEHRRAHGPFRSADELLAVRGIGPRLYQRLRPWVRVGPG